MAKILIVEPYFSGSHKSWALGYQDNSSHEIEIISLEGKFWKWRMHGGAISLANLFLKTKFAPDLILASDMLDLTTFLCLTKNKTSNLPTALYFHENQLSYPWSKSDRDVQKKRDHHYGFINIVSALAADKVLFNSEFHLESFLLEGKKFLKNFPDKNETKSIDLIKKKSRVLHLGIDLKRFDSIKRLSLKDPLILWNHRWEYDKNPKSFFKSMFKLKEKNIPFSLAVLGESFASKPNIFDEAKTKLKNEIIHFGYCDNHWDYAKWLCSADILPVTNNQDFFGASIVEAIYCGAFPLLPNRLSYPELLPTEFHKMHLYGDEKELDMMIENSLKNINKIRNISLAQYFKRFDWKSMAPTYDQLFSSIIEKKHS